VKNEQISGVGGGQPTGHFPVVAFLKNESKSVDQCVMHLTPTKKEQKNKDWIDGFVEKAFGAPEVRAVKGRSRPTQRYVFKDPLNRQLIWAEGGNELNAALVLMYMKSMGMVRRFKLQPFHFKDIDETLSGVPDILVELNDGTIYVIEVKARRYITDEVNEKLQRIKTNLNLLGIHYLLWTDADKFGKTNKLNRSLSENVRTVHRGRSIEISDEQLKSIEEMVHAGPTCLKDIHQQYGWDLTTAAWARGAFYIDLQKPIDENSPLKKVTAQKVIDYFFEKNEVVGTWWSSLEPLKADIASPFEGGMQ
jgi:hypothetical protein